MGLPAVMDGLVAAEQTIAPTGYSVEVYRWWEPHMQLPCLWNELAPSSRTERADACRVEDFLRLDVVMIGPPSPDHGRDMLGVEDYVDSACSVLDQALVTSAPLGGSIKTGRRLGLQTATAQLGNDAFLSFRIPLELKLVRSYP